MGNSEKEGRHQLLRGRKRLHDLDCALFHEFSEIHGWSWIQCTKSVSIRHASLKVPCNGIFICSFFIHSHLEHVMQATSPYWWNTLTDKIFSVTLISFFRQRWLFVFIELPIYPHSIQPRMPHISSQPTTTATIISKESCQAYCSRESFIKRPIPWHVDKFMWTSVPEWG